MRYSNGSLSQYTFSLRMYSVRVNATSHSPFNDLERPVGVDSLPFRTGPVTNKWNGCRGVEFSFSLRVDITLMIEETCVKCMAFYFSGESGKTHNVRKKEEIHDTIDEVHIRG